MLKIKLKNYSYSKAEKDFKEFVDFIHYSFLNTYCFCEENNCLKITYFTVYKTEEEYRGSHFEIVYF